MSAPDQSEVFFMRRALELAKRAWGKTHPNPMVGAVIVKNGRIIGTGFHERDGSAHAEINALNSLTENPQGATIYVTLEPCSTQGRTGACSDAIIKSGITKVVIGTLDPNPAHAGRAVKIFEANKIECTAGILEADCRNLNFIFNSAIVKKEALLALKIAQSKNGKIAETRGKPTQITGGQAREHAMRYRQLFPAIGVAYGTLVADNPALTRRNGDAAECGMRLIFDRSLNCTNLNLESFKVFSDKFSHNTRIVCDANAPTQRLESLKNKGVKIIQINSARAAEKLFWSELKKHLFDIGINGLILEGGAKVISSALNADAADYLFEYTSPNLLPESGLNAYSSIIPQIKNAATETLGCDICKYGSLR